MLLLLILLLCCQYCCSCFCLLERALRCSPPLHMLHLAHEHATCKLDDSASLAAGVCPAVPFYLFFKLPKEKQQQQQHKRQRQQHKRRRQQKKQ